MVRLLCSDLNNLDAGLPNIVDIVRTEMQNNQHKVAQRSIMEKLLNYEEVRDKALNEEEEEKDEETEIKKPALKYKKKKEKKEGDDDSDGDDDDEDEEEEKAFDALVEEGKEE